MEFKKPHFEKKEISPACLTQKIKNKKNASQNISANFFV
jgi:hypothetical protein